MFEGMPLLLLHHTGARSGRDHVNPLVYLQDGGRYVVFASKAGAPTNPDWYHNLKAHPQVSIEVGPTPSRRWRARRRARSASACFAPRPNARRSSRNTSRRPSGWIRRDVLDAASGASGVAIEKPTRGLEPRTPSLRVKCSTS